MSFSASLVIAVLFFTKTKAESTEDQGSFGFNHPSTVNFNEIFSNSLSMLNDDALTVTKDEDFHLKNLPTLFVEFQHRTSTTPTTTTTTTPRPRFLTAAYLKKEITAHSTVSHSHTTELTSTKATEFFTTEENKEEVTTKEVIPLVKSRGRGVLDLLFPASRVKGFKNVFDTIRRMLSNTF